METEIIFLVKESPEGGYEAKAVSHSIFTEADTGLVKIMATDRLKYRRIFF
jgi:hypothetical protein